MLKWKNTKVKNYSKGMTQRLGIAQALINDPELIFLDEPTDGVDPIGRKEIRDILLDLKKEGKTIFLNSHLLSEIEMICDNVAILHNGKVIHEGTVEDITTKKELFTFNLDSQIGNDFLGDLNNRFSLTNFENNSITIKLEGSKELNEVIDFIRLKGILINSVIPNKISLEDIFISLINKSNDEINKESDKL
jgi:ABC-2 type transport system ATP-binding protein